jgi:superkiller protein 3
MSGKLALKAIRNALDSKDFELAASKAKAFIEQDPANYHAYVITSIILSTSRPLANHCVV